MNKTIVHHERAASLEVAGKRVQPGRPAHWWKNQTWTRLSKHLPPWIVIRLEVYRPAMLLLQEQITL